MEYLDIPNSQVKFHPKDSKWEQSVIISLRNVKYLICFGRAAGTGLG